MIEFLGKFHPLLVHLPIGFLLLLGILEWLALRPNGRELLVANRIILLLTIPATLASTVCGWLLAADGSYDPRALFWHRWLGTTLVAATVTLWVIRQRGWLKAYRRGLFATLILLTIASHFGGSLTHGSDFLTWPKRRAAGTQQLSDEQFLRQPAYATVIHPIFDKYCVSCHGKDKSKGGLRMDTVEHLRAGGDSGPALDSANPAGSLLGHRLNLPEDDDDHMPPGGKPQLSPAQLASVKWWLESGAPTDQTSISQMKPSAEMIQTLRVARGDSTEKQPAIP